jgi:hypothetical protein
MEVTLDGMRDRGLDEASPRAYILLNGNSAVAPKRVRRVQEETMTPTPKQPLTDDSIKVRQVSHYQFSWVAGDPGKPGTWTLQLVLDQGAWEELLTLDGQDAENLQALLSASATVFYDVPRRTLMFGTTASGQH